jgi:pimeloyl-ACP methyl ester carboxylesterase
MTDEPNVVLIHGAFADGSSWSAVTENLQAKGFNVTAPQFPQTSLADDVARLRQVLAWLDGPTIVAGHSYGGQVITALGVDTGNVVGLVYVAGFGLDEGESIAALGADSPPPRALANIVVDQQGFGRLPEDDFVNHFAADVDPVKARVMHAAQQPVAMSVFEDVMGTPAWKSLPSWYLVAANDEAIDPDAERMFAKRMGAATVEVASSHVAMVSHPGAVVELIEAAAGKPRTRELTRAPRPDRTRGRARVFTGATRGEGDEAWCVQRIEERT